MAATATAVETSPPDFETARNYLIGAIDGIVQFVERGEIGNATPFSSSEFMNLYTTVYTLCDPKLVERNEGKLYDLYVLSFQNFASSKVLPSLKGKKGVELLQELLKRWEGHKIMARWLSRVFHYLNRYYLPRKALPSLMEASHSVFHDLVYSEMNGDIMDAVLSLVDRERDGERIDKSLMKEVVHIYVEMGEGSMKYYVRDFEPGLLDSTSAYYSKKSQERIETTDYEAKVKECLIQEKARVSEYLEYKSLNRICEIVEYELVGINPEP